MFLLLLAACSENELIAKDTDVPSDTGPAGADIVVEPVAVDFGAVASGEEGVATVTISNVGDADLHLGDLTLAGGSAAVTWTALPRTKVLPGGTVDTVLTWTPTGGALADTLLVASDDPDEPSVEVPLAGRLPGGDIQVEPATYDFGTLILGESASIPIAVTNVGAGPLTVTEYTYAAGDGDLHVVTAGELQRLPYTFAPGETTHVVIEYAPTAGGGDEGLLTVVSDDADTPRVTAEQWGQGDDPCDGFTQTVELFLTADDSWQGWLDGVEFVGPNQNAWNQFDTFTWEMECGDHALSLYARDTGLAIAGVIAVVKVEGAVRFVSGPTDWTMTDVSPPAGWTDPSFEDSTWHIPQVCADTSPWGATPQPFYDLGASWIWWSTRCQDLGEAWLRLNFTVP